MDHYGILGVDRAASLDEIKAAYRKLAKKHHPDLNGGDKEAEERFKRINSAYKVLCRQLRKTFHPVADNEGQDDDPDFRFYTAQPCDVTGKGLMFEDIEVIIHLLLILSGIVCL